MLLKIAFCDSILRNGFDALGALGAERSPLYYQISAIVDTLARDDFGGTIEASLDGFHTGASGMSFAYHVAVATDKEQRFKVNISLSSVGDETVLTLNGRGLQRVYMRVKVGEPLSDADREALRSFLVAGLDSVTDAEKAAEAAHIRIEMVNRAIAAASAMNEAMTESILEYVRSDASGLTLDEGSRRALKSQLRGDSAVADSFMVAAVNGRGRNARINCMANVVPSNHPDDPEVYGGQCILVGLMIGPSGGGQDVRLNSPPASMVPFRPTMTALAALFNEAIILHFAES